jgi:hypothetical protein
VRPTAEAFAATIRGWDARTRAEAVRCLGQFATMNDDQRAAVLTALEGVLAEAAERPGGASSRS